MSEEKLTVKIMVAENLEKGIEIRDMGMEEVAAEEGTTNINDRGGREGPLLKHWPLRSPSRIVRQDVAARRGATMRLIAAYELELSSRRASGGAAVQSADFRRFFLVLGKMTFFVLPSASAPARFISARFFDGRLRWRAPERADHSFKETHYCSSWKTGCRSFRRSHGTLSIL